MLRTAKQQPILGDDVARQIFAQTIYFSVQPKFSLFRRFITWLFGE